MLLTTKGSLQILSRKVEERILPLARDKGIAVMTNMPFEKARLFKLVENIALPKFALEFGCSSWGEFFLKFVLANEIVTCALLGTSDVKHLKDNMLALTGELPDRATLKKMIDFVERLPGANGLLKSPPYPGKNYGGRVKFPPARK